MKPKIQSIGRHGTIDVHTARQINRRPYIANYAVLIKNVDRRSMLFPGHYLQFDSDSVFWTLVSATLWPAAS